MKNEIDPRIHLKPAEKSSDRPCPTNPASRWDAMQLSDALDGMLAAGFDDDEIGTIVVNLVQIKRNILAGNSLVAGRVSGPAGLCHGKYDPTGCDVDCFLSRHSGEKS